LIYSDGDRFEGEYRDGKQNGYGVEIYASGTRLEGEFKDGKPNGHCIKTDTNGDRFEGEFKDGKPNGHCIKTYANGDRFEGEFKDGKTNGHCIKTDANGDRFEGEFRDDKKNGHGVFTCANGSRFEGEYRDGERNGHGVEIHATSGTRFEGEHKDGERNGHGVFTCANGDRFEGELRDGKINGHGVETSTNGDRFEGEFRDGKRYNGYKVKYDSKGKLNKLIKYENGNKIESDYTEKQLFNDAKHLQREGRYDEAYILLRFIRGNSPYWREALNDMKFINIKKASGVAMEGDERTAQMYRNYAFNDAINTNDVDMIKTLHSMQTGHKGHPSKDNDIFKFPSNFNEIKLTNHLPVTLKSVMFLQKLLLSYQEIIKNVRKEKFPEEEMPEIKDDDEEEEEGESDTEEEIESD
jgi:hypothetical protein